jgi:hypothetical protein
MMPARIVHPRYELYVSGVAKFEPLTEEPRFENTRTWKAFTNSPNDLQDPIHLVRCSVWKGTYYSLAGKEVEP